MDLKYFELFKNNFTNRNAGCSPAVFLLTKDQTLNSL